MMMMTTTTTTTMSVWGTPVEACRETEVGAARLEMAPERLGSRRPNHAGYETNDAENETNDVENETNDAENKTGLGTNHLEKDIDRASNVATVATTTATSFTAPAIAVSSLVRGGADKIPALSAEIGIRIGIPVGDDVIYEANPLLDTPTTATTTTTTMSTMTAVTSMATRETATRPTMPAATTTIPSATNEDSSFTVLSSPHHDSASASAPACPRTDSLMTDATSLSTSPAALFPSPSPRTIPSTSSSFYHASNEHGGVTSHDVVDVNPSRTALTSFDDDDYASEMSLDVTPTVTPDHTPDVTMLRIPLAI